MRLPRPQLRQELDTNSMRQRSLSREGAHNMTELGHPFGRWARLGCAMTMDRAAIEELFTFTEYSWREHEHVIRPHGDRALMHPAPGSGWPALRDALAHICWAYVRWLASSDGTTD